jgi:hypothetical protein
MIIVPYVEFQFAYWRVNFHFFQHTASPPSMARQILRFYCSRNTDDTSIRFANCLFEDFLHKQVGQPSNVISTIRSHNQATHTSYGIRAVRKHTPIFASHWVFAYRPVCLESFHECAHKKATETAWITRILPQNNNEVLHFLLCPLGFGFHQ